MVLARVKTFLAGGSLYATDLNSIEDDYNAKVDKIVPVGSILATLRRNADDGFLLMTGSTLSRSTYPRLWTVAQDEIAAGNAAFGAGDGVSTFTLANLAQRTPIGSGAAAGLTTRALGVTGGEETHLLTNGELPGTIVVPGDQAGAIGVGFGGAYTPTAAAGGRSALQSNLTIVGGGNRHNVMSPFVVINFQVRHGN